MAGATRTPEEVLGVGKDATADQIKKAYRRRARLCHPDVNKASDAEERFKELQSAMDTIRRRGGPADWGDFDPNDYETSFEGEEVVARIGRLVLKKEQYSLKRRPKLID